MLQSLVGLVILILFAISGCDGCGDEIVKITVALGNAKVVTKWIAGTHYIAFSKGDPSDTYYPTNTGFLVARHNSGCGSCIFSSGNDWVDKFFELIIHCRQVAKLSAFYIHLTGRRMCVLYHIPELDQAPTDQNSLVTRITCHMSSRVIPARGPMRIKLCITAFPFKFP
jgi:hypothetical protein